MPAGAEVDGVHHLGTRGFGPRGEFVQAEAVGFHAVPGRVEPDRPVRADAVFPAVAGDEVAAGVADHGRPEFPDQLQDVAAETSIVRSGVSGLGDPGVHGPAHVLDERAEQATRDRADGLGGVSHVTFDVDAHPALTVKPCWLP
jgi:hypothetical protein